MTATQDPLPIKVPKIRTCKVCAALPPAERPRGHPLAAPFEGPRCYHHNIAERRARRAKAAEYKQLARYGMPVSFRERLWAMQGRMCAICQRSKGKTKACAIDHDHSKPDGSASWRGLICARCNQYLGHIRDDPETARRLARYLEDPPAQRLVIAWEGELP